MQKRKHKIEQAMIDLAKIIKWVIVVVIDSVSLKKWYDSDIKYQLGVGMINRQAKKFFDYYLKIVATEEYQSYYQRHEQEGLEFHKKYIEEERPEWRTRTDYFDEFSIGEFIILDTLSNEGVNKLTKRLYSLPKSKFKVKNYYKKPTIFKKYD